MNECGLASQYSGPETTLIQPAFESQLEIRYRTLRVGVASSTANVTLNRPLRHHWGRRDFSAKADCGARGGGLFSCCGLPRPLRCVASIGDSTPSQGSVARSPLRPTDAAVGAVTQRCCVMMV